MKTLKTISILAIFIAASANLCAQDYPEEYLGLPGDNLNLYAVMNLFQESETLEGFERSLNDEESMINNLNLNGDNLIDYLSVSDYVEGNVHTIVLRAALGPKEQQDVAVFVVEKLQGGTVQIQLIGDEALYGPNYIVEPIYAETPNPGYTGKAYNRNTDVVTTNYYEIAAWPMVRYMYHPGYVVWRSSWNWGYYPGYWRPWRAHYWHYYYGYHSHWHNHYYSHYRHWDRYRCRNYHTHYHKHVRVHSPNVVVNINNDRYRTTYSRPDSRSAGEKYYANSSRTRNQANRAGVENSRQSVKRTTAPSSRTRSDVSTSGRSTTTDRSRSTKVQTSRQNGQSSVQRSSSSSKRNAPAVQRSQPSKSKSSVQRSSSASKRSSTTVKRSQPSKSKSKSSVKRSQPSKSKSSSQRSGSSRKSSSRKSSSSERSSGSSRR